MELDARVRSMHTEVDLWRGLSIDYVIVVNLVFWLMSTGVIRLRVLCIVLLIKKKFVYASGIQLVITRFMRICGST